MANLRDSSSYPLGASSVDLDRLIEEEGAGDLAPIVKSIYEQETASGRNVRTSVDGARGPMQVIPETYRRIMGEDDSGDPVKQTRAGIRYIKQLAQKSGGDPKKIAVGYFSGEGNINFADGTPYRRNAADSNGKRVADYVTEVVGRLQPVSTQAAVEIMPWGAVKETDDFKNADSDTREAMRDAYFREVVAPQIPTDQLAAARAAFESDTKPSLVERVGSTASDLAKATGEAFALAGEGPFASQLKSAVTEGWPTLATAAGMQTRAIALQQAGATLEEFDAIDDKVIDRQWSGTGNAYQNANPEERAKMRAQQIENAKRLIESQGVASQKWSEYKAALEASGKKIPQFLDIASKEDFSTWLLGNIGQGAGYMVPLIVASLMTPAAVGGLAGSAVMATGDLAGERIEKAKKEGRDVTQELQDSTAAVLGLAVPYVAFDFLGPAGKVMRERMFGAKEIIGALSKSDIVKATLKEFGKQSIEEAINEAGQEFLLTLLNKVRDSDDLVTKDNVRRWINAGAAGAAMGGPMGGSIQAARSSIEYAANKADTELQQAAKDLRDTAQTLKEGPVSPDDLLLERPAETGVMQVSPTGEVTPQTVATAAEAAARGTPARPPALPAPVEEPIEGEAREATGVLVAGTEGVRPQTPEEAAAARTPEAAARARLAEGPPALPAPELGTTVEVSPAGEARVMTRGEEFQAGQAREDAAAAAEAARQRAVETGLTEDVEAAQRVRQTTAERVAARQEAEAAAETAAAEGEGMLSERVFSAIERAVGRQRARKVKVVRSTDPNQGSLLSAAPAGAEAFYDPSTDTLNVFADRIQPVKTKSGRVLMTADQRAAWVAWHELTHRGKAARETAGYRSDLQDLARNRYVNELAQAIVRDRGGGTRWEAIEEAAAELRAAQETGDYGEIKSRYKVDVPAAVQKNLKGALTRFVARLKHWIRKITGSDLGEASDAEVFSIIRKIAAADTGAVKAPAAAKKSVAKPVRSDVKLSPAQRAVTLTDIVYGDFALVPSIKGGLEGVAQYIEGKARKALGEPRTGTTKADEDFIAGVLEHESLVALADPNNGVGWYRGNLETAMGEAAKLYPEIATDPDQRFAFAVALAITSNGTKVSDNVALAFDAFRFYRQHGIFPSIKSQIDSMRAKTMAMGFAKINVFMNQHGLGAVRDFTLTKMPAQLIKDAFQLSSVSENLTEEVYGGLFLGPKVGAAFLPNLMGRLDALTIDRWLMRTIGRITGDLIKRKGDEIQITEESDLDYDSGLKDAPRSGSQRAFIRRVFENLRDRMKERGVDAEVADFQALLWYPEKIYWQNLGVKSEKGLMTDYGAEVRKYVEAEQARAVRGQERGGRRDAGRAAELRGPEETTRLFSVAAPEREDTGVFGEVVPGQGELKDRMNALQDWQRKQISTSVATKIVPRVLNDMGVTGKVEHSIGGFDNDTAPNFIVHLPESDMAEAVEVAKVLGYVFDQQAMIAFDENTTEGDGLTSFISITRDGGIDRLEGEKLFAAIRDDVSEAVHAKIGYSVKDGKLLIGNFTEIADDRFEAAVRKALEAGENVYHVATKRFRSDWIEPGNRDEYLEGTRYGDRELEEGREGREAPRRRGRADADALRGAAARSLEGWISGYERRNERSGGADRARIVESSREGAEYGRPREASVSVVAHHYSKDRRNHLNAAMYGTGYRGAEYVRVRGDPVLSYRIYFYFDIGQGINPEGMVGPFEHTVTLNNVYDADTDPLGLGAGRSANGFERAVVDAGFDGYLTRNFGRSGAVVLIGPQHTAVPVDRGTRFSTAPAPRDEFFYSELERQLANVKAEIAPSSQWIDIINGLRNKGVKQEEIEFSGVRDWLLIAPSKKVSKQQVLDYLSENGVRITESVLSESPALLVKKGQPPIYVEWHQRGLIVRMSDGRSAQAIWLARKDRKYQVAVWPGTHAERVELDVVGSEESARRFAAITAAEMLRINPSDITGAPVVVPSAEPKFKRWSDPTGEAYTEIAIMVPGEVKYTAPSHHAMGLDSLDNRVLHVRIDHRGDVAFIQEVQSDWAQEGRDKGFRSFDPDAAEQSLLQFYLSSTSNQIAGTLNDANPEFFDSEMNETVDYETIQKRRAAWLDRLEEIERQNERAARGPFVTSTESWVSLALKRAIKYALDVGATKVAWTTGDMQNKRYKLSTFLNSMLFAKDDVDRVYIDGIGIDQERVLGGYYTPSSKEFKIISGPHEMRGEHGAVEVFGAELAKKVHETALEAAKTNKVEKITGVDLDIGGGGMKRFYDEIVPQVASKVLRKIGGGSVIDVNTSYGGKPAVVKGFEITPSMTKGAPLFSRFSGPREDFDVDPFGDQPDYGQDAVDTMTGLDLETETAALQIGDDIKAATKYSALDVGRVGGAWLALGKLKSMWTYKPSKSSDLETIAREMSAGRVTVKETKPDSFQRVAFDGGVQWVQEALQSYGIKKFKPETVYVLKYRLSPEQRRQMADVYSSDAEAWLYEDGDNLALNISAFKQNVTEGALIYQIVGTWAAHTGKKFLGDPAGLSTRALFRRTENMLVNAIRTGSTEHLLLHPNQVRAGLKFIKNDTAYNVGAMALWLRDTMAMYDPEMYRLGVTDRVKYGDEPAFDLSFEPMAEVPVIKVRGGPRTQARAAITELFDRLQADGKLPAAYGDGLDNKETVYISRVVRNGVAGFGKETVEHGATKWVGKPVLYSIAPFMRSEGHSGLLDAALENMGGRLFAQKLSGPLWDAVRNAGGRVIPERIKHGLIHDYGLPEPYLDAKITRHSNVNKVLRRSKNIIEHLSALDRDQSKIAYLWMNASPDTKLEAELMAQLPEDSREAMRAMKQAVDELGREAVRLGLLSEESYVRNHMAYLHRSYAEHLKAREGFARTYKRNATLRGDNFRGRGLRDDINDDRLVEYADEVVKGDLFVRFEKRSADGKLQRIAYVPVGKAAAGVRPAGYEPAGVWEARFFDKKGRVGMWRDLTAEERQRLGEIEEVRFAFAKTVIAGIRDIENARFLRWVDENYAKDPDEIDDDKLVPASESHTFALKTFKTDEWVIVPSTKVAGTKINKYGALAGRAIPATMWNDIRNAMSLPQSELEAFWNTALRWWKASKTALSPPVHTNNVMSNFIMADIADVRARDIIRALSVIRKAHKGDADAKRLMERYDDSGGEYGSFSSVELNENFIDPILRELEGQQAQGLLDDVGAVRLVSMALKGNLEAATALASKAKVSKAALPFKALLALYQQEDTVFRISKFLKELDKGASDTEAGKAARDAFLNYDINAPWIQTLRRTGLPFIAFSYRAIPLMLETAFKKPWKIAKYYLAAAALNALAYGMLGQDGDEERERRLLPEELQGRALGIFPRMMRLPWNDEHGSPVFLDIRRWLPGGSMLDVQQSQAVIPMPDWLSVGGPLSLIMEFFSNKSAFTGEPIIKESDTATERAVKFGDWFFKAMAPNLPLPGPGYVVPGAETGQLQTWAWQGLVDAGTGKTDPFGREVGLRQALGGAFGIKAKSYPADMMGLRAVQDFRAEEAEIQKNINSLARQFARKGISREEFDRRLEKEQDKLKKRAEELRAKLSP